MNKILYIIIIVFLGITTASGIWNFVIELQTGPAIYKFGSYIPWFLAVNIIAFAGSILILKYYYDQNYRLALITGAISVIANSVHTGLSYNSLTSGAWGGYMMVAIVINLCALILYGLALAFSNIRKRSLLKLAGICGIVIGLVLMTTVIEGSYTKNAVTIALIRRIGRWAPVGVFLVNLMFIMNFVAEIRISKTQNGNVTGREFLQAYQASRR